MRVRLVCYEDGGWILGKFARKMEEELRLLSVDVDIAAAPDPDADINHHIIYIDYDGRRNSVDTVMITHIDADWKFRKIEAQIRDGAFGICMSADTVRTLRSAGVSPERLFYVNPAHDGAMRPRPLLIGLAARIYPDGRKREGMLLKLAERIDPAYFSFFIMGQGWDGVVGGLRGAGFQVDYHADFDLDLYHAAVPSLDYFLNLSTDEGSMAFVDALSAGVPTIVTPQGYHLDAVGGLVHPFETLEDLIAIFAGIEGGKRALVDSVAGWTWREYAVKHRDLWNYLLTGALPEQLPYPDGIGALGERGAGAPRLAQHINVRFKFLKGSLRAIASSFRTGGWQK